VEGIAGVVAFAAIQARTGSWVLADLVARTATPFPGALLLTLSVVAPSVSGLHSGALGLERLLGWPLPHRRRRGRSGGRAARRGPLPSPAPAVPRRPRRRRPAHRRSAPARRSPAHGPDGLGRLGGGLDRRARRPLAAGLGVSALLGIVAAAGAMVALPALGKALRKEPV
jgi:hypothetical protein